MYSKREISSEIHQIKIGENALNSSRLVYL